MKHRRLMHVLFLLMLLPAGVFLVPGNAHAAITCNATGSALNYGTFDTQSGNQDVSATIDFTCSQTFFISVREYVTMCVSIGNGGGGQQNPRLMNGGTGDPLQFQIYANPSRTAASIWGSLGSAIAPPQTSFSVPGGFFSYGSYSGQMTVYGRVPGAQSGVTAGSYSNLLSDSFITFDNNTGGTPATCSTGNDGSFQINATATIQNTCTVSASDLNFGSVAGLLSSGNHDGTTTIGTQCVNGTVYKIGLDNGLHASGSTRRMAGPGGQLIQYELYRDSGRTQRWGNTPGTDTVNKTGSGSNQNASVYGRVPVQTTPSAGAYSDTITVSITY